MVRFKNFTADKFPLLNRIILQSRIIWSIRLRWFAIISFFVSAILLNNFYEFPVRMERLFFILGILAVINFIYFIIFRIYKEASFENELLFLGIHILVDLIALSLLIHNSGGVENPVYIFFVFHVVLSSIIFPRNIPWIISTFVVLLFSSIVLFEYYGIIHHYCIFQSNFHESALYNGLSLIAFIVTVYVTTYICTTFMRMFREIKSQVDFQKSELEVLSKEKSRFFRFTSHELKAPLIAVKSSVDTVVKLNKEAIDDRSINLLQRASFRAGQMLNIITELLDLSNARKLDEDKELVKTDLLEIIKKIIYLETPKAEEKRIKISFQDVLKKATIMARRGDTEKVFLNLISNAINYTESSGTIIITLERDKNRAIVKVSDTGIGIPGKDLENIFSEFYRTENAKKTVSFGTGLGLSLVKSIIDNYDWNINVKSEINRGTEFVVSIPLVN